MAERCGFFNATNSSNPDRVYNSSDFAAYFASFIGNGVFAKHSDQLRVAQQDSPDMSVKVLGGQAWINGWWYENTSTLNIDIDPADGMLDRIDIIVVQFDLTNRVIKTIVRKGSPSAGATAPSLNRDDDLWELKLAEVNVSHGTVNITDGKITDTRSDTTVCGWVSGLIDQMDTTKLFNQLKEATQDAVDAMNDALDGTVVGKLQTQIDETKRLKPVNKISDSTDLNTLTEPGSWFCSGTDVANTPYGVTGKFLLYVYSSDGVVAHELHSSIGTWWRWKIDSASSWDKWIMVLAPNGPLPLADGGTGATTPDAAMKRIAPILPALESKVFTKMSVTATRRGNIVTLSVYQESSTESITTYNEWIDIAQLRSGSFPAEEVIVLCGTKASNGAWLQMRVDTTGAVQIRNVYGGVRVTWSQIAATVSFACHV